MPNGVGIQHLTADNQRQTGAPISLATRSAICCLSRSIGCLIQPPSAPEASLDQWRSPVTVFAVMSRKMVEYFVEWCRSQPGRPSKWPRWIIHSFAHREVNVALVAHPMVYGIGSFIDDHRNDPHHNESWQILQ